MNKEEQTIKSEASIFFSKISEYLPKSIERSALGDEKIYQAFHRAYIEFIPVLVNQIRLETLKEVLPEKMTNEGHPYASKVHNECRQEIINKAKAKWGIIL